MSGRGRVLGFGLAVLAIATDQVAKAVVLASPSFAFGGAIELGPYLNLVLVRNTGVSFGLLRDLPLWTVVAMTGLIAALFCVWLWRAGNAVTAAGFGLIIGGAVSNILDRFRHGAVTDFIDAHWGELHWPAFNAADAAITIGVGILLLSGLFLRQERVEGADAVGDQKGGGDAR